ncbi:hypothetical protein F4604DRAFT_1777592, partial [Suillus subluteus]
MKLLMKYNCGLAYAIYLVSFVNGDRPSRNNVHTKATNVLYAYIVSDLRYERVETDAVPHHAFVDCSQLCEISQGSEVHTVLRGYSK